MIKSLITSFEGLSYYAKYKEDIAKAIKSRDEDATEEEFCIFVHESGYMILTPDGYEKLSKRDKKKIEKAYEHKQVAEYKRTDE